MYRRLCYAILPTIWLAMAATAIAGPYDVTFQVPLNLTGLSPDITKVQVDCTITSAALPKIAIGFVEPPTTGGQVVSTATVVVPVTSLDTSGGKTSASYTCRLTVFSQSHGWGRLDAASTVPIFRASSTPTPITGTFTW